MKAWPVALAAAMLLAPVALANGAGGTTRGIANSALIAAAKASALKLIDDIDSHCDGAVTVEAWLKALTAPEAKAIAWSAGRCELVNSLNPLDSGGNYCVQATLTLKHPKNRSDRPQIEIYLEDPKHGKPGAAYAFRATFDSVDGPDYIRFRKDFEDEWRARFTDAPGPTCDDG